MKTKIGTPEKKCYCHSLKANTITPVTGRGIT